MIHQRHEPPQQIEAEVDGDLRGRGVWTLTPAAGGTHVRFDWTVHADRPLLRVLTPFLRPALRSNHNWAIARAVAGLEPFAVARAGQPDPSRRANQLTSVGSIRSGTVQPSRSYSAMHRSA